MQKKEFAFAPVYSITPRIAAALMRVEAMREAVRLLPITTRVLRHLRETARLEATHYSTMIEGNRLTPDEVALALGGEQHFPGRERDRQEIEGYYAGLSEVERLAARGETVTKAVVQRLHALVMGGGRMHKKATPWRDGQNVIRDSRSNSMVYLPPEAQDVERLMAAWLAFVNRADDLPVPLRAALAHYQFATIHPFYDGNGRTARLLTTLILHRGGYDLKGIYALEEYYARDLQGYYQALTVGPSHNYYLGRAEADLTGWVGYFIEGMAASFEKVRDEAQREAMKGSQDQSRLLRGLEARQRRVLQLFEASRTVAARQVGEALGLQQRATAQLCQRWVEGGFLQMENTSRKARLYRLSDRYEEMLEAR